MNNALDFRFRLCPRNWYPTDFEYHTEGECDVLNGELISLFFARYSRTSAMRSAEQWQEELETYAGRLNQGYFKEYSPAELDHLEKVYGDD